MDSLNRVAGGDDHSHKWFFDVVVDRSAARNAQEPSFCCRASRGRTRHVIHRICAGTFYVYRKI